MGHQTTPKFYLYLNEVESGSWSYRSDRFLWSPWTRFRERIQFDRHSISQGDKLGCGFTSDRRIFFTKNDKIVYSDTYPVEFPDLYPVLWIGKPAKLIFNMEATNPCGAYIPTPLNTRSWHEWLGSPLGIVDYTIHEETETNIGLESIPEELLQVILGNFKKIKKIRFPFELLSTSKRLHKNLSPFVKWIDVHAIRNKLSGHIYHFYEHQTKWTSYENPKGVTCYGVVYEIKSDGTYSAIQKILPIGSSEKRVQKLEGNWALSRCDGISLNLGTQDLFLSTYKTRTCIDSLSMMKVPGPLETAVNTIKLKRIVEELIGGPFLA